MNLELIKISTDRLVSICKYRQGKQCCKYIVYLHEASDFVCSKNQPDLSKIIHNSNVHAVGDNCPGLPIQ